EAPATGRVLDLENQPVVGAAVSVVGLAAPIEGDLGAFLTDLNGRQEANLSMIRHLAGLRQTQLGTDGGLFPKVRTGSEGCFTVRGVGRERLAILRITGPTIEAQDVHVLTRPGIARLRVPASRAIGQRPLTFGSAGLEHFAPPTTVIVGVVRAADSGKPIPGTVVCSYQRAGDSLTGRTDLMTTADREG